MQSEDDGQGEIEGQGGEVRRRKKKGLKEKLKERLTGGKSKEEQSQTAGFTSTATTTTSTGAISPGAQPYPEHEKCMCM